MPRDWHPTIAFDPATGIATARGYVGHGVAATNLAGRVLTDLITGTRSPLTELPVVEPPVARTGRSSRSATSASATRSGRSGASTTQIARTGRPPTGRSLAERLAAH